MKKNIINTLYTFQYVFFLTATCAVLSAQFIANANIVFAALIAYTTGFLVTLIKGIINAVEIFFASSVVGNENALVSNSKLEVLDSKKERVKAIIINILWLAMFGFSLAVTIMYAIRM